MQQVLGQNRYSPYLPNQKFGRHRTWQINLCRRCPLCPLRLRSLSLRRMLWHLSPESVCQEGPLRLRVYRGGFSFGTNGCPLDSPDPDKNLLTFPPHSLQAKRIRQYAIHFRHGANARLRCENARNLCQTARAIRVKLLDRSPRPDT